MHVVCGMATMLRVVFLALCTMRLAEAAAPPTASPTAAPSSAPTSAPSSAPTGAIEVPAGKEIKIKVQMTVANVDYDTLMTKPNVLALFKLRTQESIAEAAGPAINKNMVEVLLYRGSVRIEAFITPPDASMVSSIESAVTAASSTLQSNMVTRISAIPGVEQVTTGVIAVTAPVVEALLLTITEAPTPAPTTDNTYKIVRNGTCVEAGLTRITTEEECEWAAGVLRLRDTSVYTECKPAGVCDKRPPGCIYARNYYLQLNPRGVGVPCGAVHGPNKATYDCICRGEPTAVPTAAPTPAPTPAPGPASAATRAPWRLAAFAASGAVASCIAV
eukprot:TRINITY_DN95202_c0_g1_i1.p1 TRINITY_DN95202_c0_g1~~TRINITY_DN95202_c0_g1_i1.p1  ORF type:complete len:332 (+),score=64.50 TRINITY_DN95202_c0_g1_i1:66-1061(+)